MARPAKRAKLERVILGEIHGNKHCPVFTHFDEFGEFEVEEEETEMLPEDEHVELKRKLSSRSPSPPPDASDDDSWFEEERDRLRASFLATVHVWDLTKGGKIRDWNYISSVSKTNWTETQMRQEMKCLRKAADTWFPYPPIPLSEWMPKRQDWGTAPNEYPPPMDTGKFGPYHKHLMDWDVKVDELRRAAQIMPAWALFTPQVRGFFGYHDVANPEYLEQNMSFFDERLIEAIKLLSPEDQARMQLYRQGDEELRDWWEIDEHMNALRMEFFAERSMHVGEIRQGQAVGNIRDIAYYRRKLLDENGDLVRYVMSDYEFSKLYMTGIEDDFDFESMDSQEWGDYITHLGIHNVKPSDARDDFFKYCLPRLGLLKSWFTPGNVSAFRYKVTKSRQAAYTMVYNSVKERSFAGVLQAVYNLAINGLVDMKLIGGPGFHTSAFLFMLAVLNEPPDKFGATDSEFYRTRKKFAADVLKNYRRIQYSFNGNLHY